MRKLEPDADQAKKYDVAKYNKYIAQDFDRHRVFVDIDDFMKHVLHVPGNWKQLWGGTIGKIKRDKVFSAAHRKYTTLCGIRKVTEAKFYRPLVDMQNAILRVCASEGGNVQPRTSQRYFRNDPYRVSGGVTNDLSPDIVAIHRDYLPNVSKRERTQKWLRRLNWAHPLQVLEVKPWVNALVDGSSMPRLKVDGEPTSVSRATRLLIDQGQGETQKSFTHAISRQ